MFSDVTWINTLISGLTSILGIIQEPPISYFVILALVAKAAFMVRGFVKIRG